ncbi:D-alanyl-D-alanine carboxypeptidase family protein [Saccharibacillus alkalitolerans]|uniref:D-alanyl-D-alanine carboxypeptidase n=1 Tax=Saccharibacillus alkalitolerans TaxID=2705290 RepID=A0ABX0F6K7_9BACL|nr:serine hydrolase [Saccharibacillus alkalitolerans]NGZ76591.1 D-alanyl-D-alanine carboxypeptidase [Saccharibacillus alkalitolerans]
MNGSIWKKGILILLAVLLLLIPQQLLAGRPKVEAAAAVLIDAQTGEILWQAEGDRVLPASGMTQLMTEWLVLDAIRGGRVDWEDSIRIGSGKSGVIQASQPSPGRGGDSMPLRAEDRIPLNELFMGMTVSSSGEAEKALAYYAGGSEASFAWMMNERARRIGLSASTSFKPAVPQDEAGVSEESGASRITARDTAMLCRALIKAHPEILRMSSVTQTEISSRGLYLTNSNAMLPEFAGPYAYRGMDGLKAYGSEKDGYSLAGTAQRDGQRLIVVIMGAESRDKSFQAAGRLLDYGYARSGSFAEKATSWLKLV